MKFVKTLQLPDKITLYSLNYNILCRNIRLVKGGFVVAMKVTKVSNFKARTPKITYKYETITQRPLTSHIKYINKWSTVLVTFQGKHSYHAVLDRLKLKLPSSGVGISYLLLQNYSHYNQSTFDTVGNYITSSFIILRLLVDEYLMLL